MAAQKNNMLNATDIIILSLIFFGYATFNSIAGYLQLQQAGMAAPTDWGLDAASSYSSIVLELVELLAAWIYLRWRRFDFYRFWCAVVALQAAIRWLKRLKEGASL